MHRTQQNNPREAVNQQRRDDKGLMQALGIKTRKAFRKWQKAKRRELRETKADQATTS